MVKRRKKTSQEALREALILIAPGTFMREALSAIIQSSTGALIVINDLKKMGEISEGGVKLDEKVTPQLLYELAKMDGAIILDKYATRILFANRYLRPDPTIPSEETGTRHRVAQRVAHQTKCAVIAVSQRRASVTLYVHDLRYVLDSIPTLLNKATQAVQTLEKYLHVLQQALRELTVREFQDMVTIFDVCRAVQRTEMVMRIAREIEPHILELGSEGRLIELQCQELLQPMEEAELVFKDYFRARQGTDFDGVRERIRQLTSQELLNLGNISQALGYGTNLRSIDTYLTPRGYRMLTATHRLPSQIIENLVQRFGSLPQIIRAPKDELCDVDGIGDVLAERIRVSLNLLRSQVTMEDLR